MWIAQKMKHIAVDRTENETYAVDRAEKEKYCCGSRRNEKYCCGSRRKGTMLLWIAQNRTEIKHVAKILL